MSVLVKATHRWKAHNARKALAGMVVYELPDFNNEEVRLPFEPKVEYREEFEPYPWVVL